MAVGDRVGVAGPRTEPDLDLAARLLWQTVPVPYVPPPKPQKAWRGLSAGRHLRLLETWFDGAHKWPAGSVFVVEAPTSAGVRLRPLLTGPSDCDTVSGMEPIPWSQPSWKDTFETVRRPAKKRGAKK